MKSYANICAEELKHSSLFPGIKEVLEELKALSISCFVSTGGDFKEAIDTLQNKGLFKYFDKVFGNDRTKDEHLVDIFKTYSATPTAVFFGDSKKVFEVALKYICDFVFVSSCSEWVEAKYDILKCNHTVIKDFTQIKY